MKIRKAFVMMAACLVAAIVLAPLGLWAQETPAEAPAPPPAVAPVPAPPSAPAGVEVTVEHAETDLAAVVSETLRHDPFAFPYFLKVTEAGGKITLRGKVDTETSRARVELVVSKVPGVTEIDNRVTIDPNLFLKTDRDIKDSVEKEFIWSPLVPKQAIIVQVADGIVTLHGEVKDLRAVHAASANARQGGAKKVVNKLTIKPSPNGALASPWQLLGRRSKAVVR